MTITFLILFFLSLAGIIFILTKKLVLLRKGQLVSQNSFTVEIPKVQEIRYIVVKNIRKHSYLLVVIVIRFSMKSSKLLKQTLRKTAKKTGNLIDKYIFSKEEELGNEKREVSRFLKMISDYKQKIRKIRHQIKEEETK